MTTASAEEVARGVRALMPGLRRLAGLALVLDCLAVLVSGGIFYLAWFSDMGDRARHRIEFYAPVLAITTIFAIRSWMRRRQEALVMPVLAQSIGLAYRKDAKPFVDRLPARVLPERGIRVGEDHVVVRLGAHELQMAEMKIVTGGKHSETLFQGIAAWFPNRATLPAFFLFQDRKVRNGAIIPRELSTDGLHHVRDVTSARRTYGIWTSQPLTEEPPALSVVVDALLKLEERIKGSELYAASSTGQELHVVMSHTRNLFRVGGTFPTEARLFKDVQSAMEDLKIPLTLAEALIQTEETALAKS